MATGIGSAQDTQERHSLIIQQINDFNEQIEVTDKEGKITESGNFNNACKETCSISMDLSNNKVYKMVILVEEGTLLKLKGIAYSINEEPI